MTQYNIVVKDQRPKVVVTSKGVQGPAGTQGSQGPQGPTGPQGPAGQVPFNAGLFKGPWMQTGYVDLTYTDSNVVMVKGTRDGTDFVPDVNGDLTVEFRVAYHTLLDTDYYYTLEGNSSLGALEIRRADQFQFHPVVASDPNIAGDDYLSGQYRIPAVDAPYFEIRLTGSTSPITYMEAYAYIQPYAQNVVVTHNNSLWQSTKANNSATPAVGPNWTLLVKGAA